MLKRDDIKRQAEELGFDACGVARADVLGDDEYPLKHWLASGKHAAMGYMERNVGKRMDPRQLVAGAKSIICVARGYNPSALMQGPKGRIARYAYGEDYHKQLRDSLHRLALALGIEAKVCVDTVPISDKHWAARAGLGWIGRHTLLVTPQWGTWVNLGELVTTEECDSYDTPLPSPCADCNRCVEACPNDALAQSGPPMLDANRCTAYHTIENRAGKLPEWLNRGGYSFGCDLCQEACPYNMGVRQAKTIDSQRIRALEALKDASEPDFEKTTAGSAMERITYQQWQRNLQDTDS